MKKIITLLLFASFGHLAKSQQGEIGDGVFSERKFHWKQIKDTVTGWHDEDTIKYNQKGDTDWVYTDWKKQPTPESYNTESFFYLYGKDPSYYKYQNRVCVK